MIEEFPAGTIQVAQVSWGHWKWRVWVTNGTTNYPIFSDGEYASKRRAIKNAKSYLRSLTYEEKWETVGTGNKP